MNRIPTLALTALLSLALLPHGAALHCNGTITTIPAGTETLYIDDRSDATYPLNHWFYLESNGIEGLQSGGGDIFCKECLPFTFVDPCEHINPDEYIL